MNKFELQTVVQYDDGFLKERRLILTRLNSELKPFTIFVSGSCDDSPTRKFYYRWSKCEHKKKIVTLDPPDLSHFFSLNVFTDGTILAAICPECCDDSLLITCPNLFVESSAAQPFYRVTVEELNLLLDEEDVYLLEEGFYVTKGKRLPQDVLDVLERVELEGVKLKLTRFATQTYTKMSVKDARERNQRLQNQDVICLN